MPLQLSVTCHHHQLMPRNNTMIEDSISPRSARTLEPAFANLTPITSINTSTSSSSSSSFDTEMQLAATSLSPLARHQSAQSISSINLIQRPITHSISSLHSPGTPLVARPDLNAFKREQSIEKRRRSSTQKTRVKSSSSSSSGLPRPSSSLGSTPSASRRASRGFAIPNARDRRVIMPATPMKTPASIKANSGSRIVYQNDLLKCFTNSRSNSLSVTTPMITRSVSRAQAASTPTRALFLGEETEEISSPKRSDAGQIFFGNFENLGELGMGDFGVVYQARARDTGQLFAIKKAKKPFRSQAEQARGLREVEHFKVLLDSVVTRTDGIDPLPHVVLVYRAWLEDGHLYIQSEHLPGTLREAMMEPVSEDVIWDWTAQLLQGLQFLHSCGLYHLDIKPSNVFRTRAGTLKIGDLGTSLRASESGGEIEEGDSQYIAPELLDHTLGQVGAHSDVFSLGLTLFEIAADVELPSRGDAWNQLRHEVIDWNGLSWYADSPGSIPEFASPNSRAHLIQSSNNELHFSSPSPLSRMSPLMMEASVQSSTISLSAEHSLVKRRMNSGRESPAPLTNIDVASGPAMSPTSTHPSQSNTDDEDDIIRTPIVRAHMTRNCTTPHSRGMHGHSLSMSSPATQSRYESPQLSVIKRRTSSLASAAGLRSDCLRSFINDMLRREPTKRPTIPQLLAHPNVVAAIQRRSENMSLVSHR